MDWGWMLAYITGTVDQDRSLTNIAHKAEKSTQIFKSMAETASEDVHHSSPQLEVVIEIPRGSFFKRGSSGELDFVSPFPCPFNYGSVPEYLGLEGDLLDAVVLGPRLSRGTRVVVRAFGAVGLTDRGMYDDKLICSQRPPRWHQRLTVLLFFRFYGRCKGLLNLWRGRPGRTVSEGWCDAGDALARARPRDGSWQRPIVPF